VTTILEFCPVKVDNLHMGAFEHLLQNCDTLYRYMQFKIPTN